MSAVFADTFYFLALLDSRDAAHAKAINLSRRPGLRLVTTDYVILELADALNKRTTRAEFIILWESLQGDAAVKIIVGNNNLWQRGMQLYQKRPDKEWQLTDCISFLVMEDLGLKDALTGDKHFAQAGFKPLLA
jgi:predicted nucleic acid-binding protein